MANVVFLLGYVQNESVLSKNKVLQDKYGEKRAFYSCNKADMDYLKYVEYGTTEQVSKPYFDDYMNYSGNNEKSSGVFNKDGLMNSKNKSELRKELRGTKSVIWHGLISFEEMFGKRYLPSYEEAHRLMKLEFPRFLKNAGFDPDKIEWFAGLHENTMHRHIHFSFFEKEPSRYSPHKKGLQFSRGKISQHAFERFKINIEQRLTDISSEIKCSRKELLDITKSLLFSPQSKMKYQGEIQSKLLNLLFSLPKDGRISYDSENMRDLKPQVNLIIDNLMKINTSLYKKFNNFCEQVQSKDTRTLQMLKASKIHESEWYKYLVADKYLTDIYRRLGNQIINAVKTIKNKGQSSRSRLANKRIRRNKISRVIAYALQLNCNFEQDATETFQEFLRKLDRERNKYEVSEEYEME